MATNSACCAEFYADDAVQALLGPHFHPGGEALSARTVASLGLQPGMQVLDLACGIGTTAIAIGSGAQVDVVGVDAAATNVAKATAVAAEGLCIDSCADESGALVELIVELKRKLLVVGIGSSAGLLPALGMDLRSARDLLARGRALVDSGAVSYVRIAATREGGRRRVAAVDCCDPATGCC